MSESLATVAYIGAAILFVLSLGGLSNPETSRRGNFYGMNGNYSAGILEGIAHYHPDLVSWMGLETMT